MIKMSEPWNLSPMARSGAVTHAPWRKGHPQTPYQAVFSVRIAHRNPKGTSTNAISSGFLCSNCPSEPGRDIHKHHIKQFSLFERAIGDRIMARLAKLASQQKLSAVFGIPPYSLRHARHRGQGLFIAKLSGQECRRDMHPTQA